MKRIKRDFFASSTAIAHSTPCHPEACFSPKDLPRCFRPECQLHGFYATRGCSPLALILVTTLLETQSFAQGCASCYTTTAAGGSQTIHALRSGILVLLVPPVLLFIGIMFVLLRWRRPKVDVISTTREMDAIR